MLMAHLAADAAGFDDADLRVIAQCPKTFSLGRSPTMLVLGDDIDRSLGPDAFHLPSVRRALRSAGAAIIVSSGPILLPYAAAATAAVLGRKHAVLIETREQHEKPWLDLVQQHAPNAKTMLSTVFAGTA